MAKEPYNRAKNWKNLLSRDAMPPLGETAIMTDRGRFHLSSMVTSCGHATAADSTYDFNGLDRGERPFAIFQYTLRGQGALVYEGRHRSLDPGTAMLVHIPHDHRYFLPPSCSEWEFIYVCVSGHEALRLLQQVEAIAGPCIRLEPDSPAVQTAVRIIFGAAGPRAVSPYELSAMAYSLSVALCESAEHAGIPVTREVPRSVGSVQDFVRSHLRDRIPVALLAAQAGYSTAHFSRRFRDATGLTPREFVENERLKRAMQLLFEGASSVKEVAWICGYADVDYFRKVFRSRTGMTPGDYRRNRL